jgi:hypothetical protein
MKDIINQIIYNLKIKLSIDIKDPMDPTYTEEDAQQDELLEALCEDAYDYMYLFFECDEDSDDNYDVPAQLRFVLEGVVVKRYRRIGAEGIAIEKIDVLSTTYESGDDFAEYLDIMNKYKRRMGRENGPKGFRFL